MTKTNAATSKLKSIFLSLLLVAAPAEASDDLLALARRDVSTHDPSTIVRCKDEYWVFSTGRGIFSRHSADLVHWSAGPPVFSRVPAWTTNLIRGNYGHFWAPDVIHLGNRYLLYYAVSTWGKNTSAIGLATNATLDPSDPSYAWRDAGPVFQTTASDDCNAIDPAIFADTDGKLWLVFGSFWTGIKLTQLDPATGKRIDDNAPVYSLAHHDKIEASYLYRHDEYYYLFVNWGQCCRGVASTYNIRIGRSPKVTGPYFDKNGANMMADGGSLLLGSEGSFIGPGHAGIVSRDGKDWLSCHFYDGTQGGRPMLGILPLKWNADGWPEIAK